MPLRLSRLIRSIASATDPRGVLDALQKRAEPLNVLTIGTLDNHSNAFFHDSVPVKYRQDYLTSLRQHGEGPMSRYAKIEPLPFTFTEARQKLKPIGRDNWAFDLLNDYEIRDGYIVPHGNWAVLFWSERVLRNVSHETRLALDASASAAVYRLKELMPKERVRHVELSPRELAVLSHLSRGLRVPAIAKRMELSEHTVRIYLRRAQKKLSAATPTQATVIAVRRRMI